MENSACVARHEFTQEPERLRDHLHDTIHSLEFEDPSNPCLDIVSRPAGVLCASIVECCGMLGNVGEMGDGQADGVP